MKKVLIAIFSMIISVNAMALTFEGKLGFSSDFLEQDGVYFNMGLDIYGEGPMRQELEEYIERKGCRVRLQGRSANIASQMKSAQVFVLSSDYEGMSNAMIEAMYLGLPVISTKVSGAKELIIDHINGCFADDANSIAQAFSYLSENETAAREIGLRASNTIKHLVDKNTVLQQWMDIIEKYTKL